VALLAPALAAILLAAHFLRSGEWAGVAASLALLAVLAIPRRAAARAAQAGLLLGAAEWVRTLVRLVAERRAEGAPYARLAAILGGVAAWTAASALVFQSRRLRERDRAAPADPVDPPL
jgi:hypothetical protein